MRALVISTVVGALALSGCQNMEYDKAAIGTGLGALLGAGLAYSNADKDKMGQAAAIGAVVGSGAGLLLDKKEKRLVTFRHILMCCALTSSQLLHS